MAHAQELMPHMQEGSVVYMKIPSRPVPSHLSVAALQHKSFISSHLKAKNLVDLLLVMPLRMTPSTEIQGTKKKGKKERNLLCPPYVEDQ